VAPLLLAVALLGGCGPGFSTAQDRDYAEARLRFVRSQATLASWSFAVDDHARGATLLIDGRPRALGCDRAGRELRCELRGLFPGGHTVELRLPGAVLRRSVVIGRPWPARPALVRVRHLEEARAAAEAGADAVIAEAQLGIEALQEIAELVHAKSVRLIVTGDPLLIARAGADGVLDAPLPPELARQFPESLALGRDATASALAAGWKPGALPDPRRLGAATGLIEAPGLVGGALALLSPRGAIVTREAFPLLAPRKRHLALRAGAHAITTAEAARIGYTLTRGEVIAVLVNATPEPWLLKPEVPGVPLDLLGGHVKDDQVTVAPNDVALLITSPQPDKTRF